MRKWILGWTAASCLMGLGVPSVVRAEERVAPGVDEVGPVEVGMTLSQREIAAGSEAFLGEANQAIAAAMNSAGSSGEPQEPPQIPKPKPPQPVDRDGNPVPPSPGPKPKPDPSPQPGPPPPVPSPAPGPGPKPPPAPSTPPPPVGPPPPAPSPGPITITIPTITITPLPGGPTIIEVDVDGDGTPEYIITIGPGIFDIGKPVLMPPGGWPPPKPLGPII